jgi:alpha-glucosidase
MAIGSISPFFRAHVTSGVPGQEPWQFGTETRDLSRALFEERYRLLPTWYSLAYEASTTGAPMLRPLVFEFQDDPMTHDLDDEAMVGPFLLVAPVTTPGATSRSVYLPAGRWYEVASGAAYDGPTTIEVSVTAAALPMFARAGAIVPRGPVLQHTGEAAVAPLSIDLYPGPEPTTFALYEDAGDGHGDFAITRYTLASTAEGARLTVAPREGGFVPPARTLHLRLRRADGEVTAVRVDGAPLADGWRLDPDDRAIVVDVPDRDGVVYDLVYDRAVTELRPDVAVTLEVHVPDGTPTDPPVHVATSANGWTQQPLAWTDEPGVARGTILVPRGEWFFYKYTRGDWATVEKWPDCVEASDRYRFGSATARQLDTVHLWSDACAP